MISFAIFFNYIFFSLNTQYINFSSHCINTINYYAYISLNYTGLSKNLLINNKLHRKCNLLLTNDIVFYFLNSLAIFSHSYIE